MRMFFPGRTHCALCKRMFAEKENVFVTSKLFVPTSDQLYPYSDTCMHWDCYVKWPFRREFSRIYFATLKELYDVYWETVYSDDQVHVVIGPLDGQEIHTPIEVYLILALTGSMLTFPVSLWENVMGGSLTCRFQHELEESAFLRLLPSLQEAIPTEESLLDAIDWPLRERKIIAYQLWVTQLREQESSLQSEKMQADYNQMCRRVVPWLKKREYPCPYCKSTAESFALHDGKQKEKSYFVCLGCKQPIYLKDLNEVFD
jgi:hypothetical protein